MKIREFFSKWKEGIKNITPIQFTWINLQGILLVLVGAAIGLYVTYGTTWWLFVILCGTVFITINNMVQTIQRLLILYDFKKGMEEGVQEDEEEKA